MKSRTLIAIMLGAATLACPGCSDREQIREKLAREKEKLAHDAAMLHRTHDTAPVAVKVVTVAPAVNTSSVSYVGRVEPSKSAIVLNQFPGTLEELHAVRGRRIRRGEPIATISSEAIRSAYDIARATLDQAEDGYARAQKVYESGSVTEVKMVEIRTQLEKARAAEKSARQALEDCQIRAPFTGVVGEIYSQKGEHLAAAAPLIQILDVESIEIHFNVPEGEYALISVGDTASVEIPALKKCVTGTVAVKGVSASTLSHAYDFTLKNVSDPSSMMPGMVCKVRIFSKGNDKIVIPASAVMTDMEGRYIWGVTPENTVCKTYITSDGYADKGIIVTEGLQEGDRIIVEGSRKVSTGMKVEAIETEE